MRTIRFEADLVIENDDLLIDWDDPESVAWFRDNVLLKDNLFHNNDEIGDTIGIIRAVRIISGLEVPDAQD